MPEGLYLSQGASPARFVRWPFPASSTQLWGPWPKLRPRRPSPSRILVHLPTFSFSVRLNDLQKLILPTLQHFFLAMRQAAIWSGGGSASSCHFWLAGVSPQLRPSVWPTPGPLPLLQLASDSDWQSLKFILSGPSVIIVRPLYSFSLFRPLQTTRQKHFRSQPSSAALFGGLTAGITS